MLERSLAWSGQRPVAASLNIRFRHEPRPRMMPSYNLHVGILSQRTNTLTRMDLGYSFSADPRASAFFPRKKYYQEEMQPDSLSSKNPSLFLIRKKRRSQLSPITQHVIQVPLPNTPWRKRKIKNTVKFGANATMIPHIPTPRQESRQMRILPYLLKKEKESENH